MMRQADRFAYFDAISPAEILAEAEIGPVGYSPEVRLSEFAVRVSRASREKYQPGPNFGNEGMVLMSSKRLPTAADCITLLSFGLGLWWCIGGPAWAAILSILGDEIDGRLARATNTQSERGAFLDWGADVTLTPLALIRVVGPAGVLAAPAILFVQSSLKSEGYRPPVGSARAVIMLAGLAL